MTTTEDSIILKPFHGVEPFVQICKIQRFDQPAVGIKHIRRDRRQCNLVSPAKVHLIGSDQFHCHIKVAGINHLPMTLGIVQIIPCAVFGRKSFREPECRGSDLDRYGFSIGEIYFDRIDSGNGIPRQLKTEKELTAFPGISLNL